VPAFKLAAAESWLTGQGWDAVDASDGINTRMVMGDWNRDGRDDVMALVKDGSGVKVVVLKAGAGSFQSAGQTWANSTATFDSLRPVAFHGNLDGFADLALLQQVAGNVNEFWLSTTMTGTMQTATAMTVAGSPSIVAGNQWASGPAF